MSRDYYNGTQVADLIDECQLNFNLGNTVKYVCRAGKKTEDAREDLQKAVWYLEREIDRLGPAETAPNMKRNTHVWDFGPGAAFQTKCGNLMVFSDMQDSVSSNICLSGVSNSGTFSNTWYYTPSGNFCGDPEGSPNQLVAQLEFPRRGQ